MFLFSQHLDTLSIRQIVTPVKQIIAIGGLVYLPSCIGDVCWTAAVLSALGTTLSVILDIDTKLAISFSAIVAIVYTLIGGMYSVAYTDVIQIAFIFGGLWIAIPFMWSNENVS